jgi:hypothetical protein
VERTPVYVRAMNRRSIIIILVALVVVGLIILSWLWFFRWQSNNQPATGNFGSGGNNTSSSTATFPDNNLPIGGGQNTASGGTNVGSGSGTNIPIRTGGTGTGGTGSTNTSGGSGGSVSYPGSTPAPGISWVGGGGPTTDFTPTNVNSLNDGSFGGEVVLYGTPPEPKTTTDLSGALTVLGIGTALCTAGFLPGVLAATGAAAAAVGAPGVPSADVGLRLQSVMQVGALTNDQIRENFLNCVTRTIARAAVQQITSSVVNWINSGFNGKPSFVQNYQQFFANVADQAAGEYIKGSALSFLCSAIGPQIRIALAKSYANRNNAATCTLSKVSNNIQSFMNGNFGAGGWSGLLQFTTVPTNNPFGAFSYAQVGLSGVQSQALQNQSRNITPGGFISMQQEKNCITSASSVGGAGKKVTPIGLNNGQQQYRVCDLVTATPGSVIESSLNKTVGGSLDSLNLAKSFDEIISALVSQLMTRTLYQGLSNLSGTNGYQNNFLTPAQQQAQKDGNSILVTLQGLAQIAQQYGNVMQGSITDIQNTQQQLSYLSNCWESASTSPSLTASQRAQAGGNAQNAQLSIQQLEQRITFFNTEIVRTNGIVATLQSLQTRTLAITSPADVSGISADLEAARAAGGLISPDDVATASQNRTTLQSELSSTNTKTSNDLKICQAFGK